MPNAIDISPKVSPGRGSATDEVPGLDLAFALDRDCPPGLKDELVCEQLFCRPGDLDPARGPRAGAEGAVTPFAYVRRGGRLVEHTLPRDPQHWFGTDLHRRLLAA